MVRTKLIKDAIFVLIALVTLLFAISMQSCSSASGKLRPRSADTPYKMDSIVRCKIVATNEITFVRLSKEEQLVMRPLDIIYINPMSHSTQGPNALTRVIIYSRVSEE